MQAVLPAFSPDRAPGREFSRRAAADRRARRALRLSRLIGLAIVGLLLSWSIFEPAAGFAGQVYGDIIVVFIASATAFVAASYSRRTHVEVERTLLDEAEERARRDELSGLYNIRYLRSRLHDEIVAAARDRSTFALVLLDLDNFKDVNDRLGHLAGDELIAAIGRAIGAAVGDHSVAARQGGDEFSVLIPGASAEDAHALARHLANAIRQVSVSSLPGNAHVEVSASYGIAVFPHDATTAEALTAAADRGLYRAKADMLERHARSTERSSQDVFFAIGEAIGRSLDPHATVTNFCQAVGQSLGIDACAIWRSRDDGSFQVAAYYASDPALVEQWSQLESGAPVTHDEAVRHGMLRGHHFYVDDLAAAVFLPERFRRVLPDGMWLVGAPVHGVDGAMIMVAASHESCAPPESGLVLAIAQLAGAAIVNADTYQRARRQAEQLADLAGLGGLFVGDGDFEQRLDAVVRRISEVTGIDMVTVDTADPTGVHPFLRSFHGRSRDGGEFDPEIAALWRAMRPALTDKAVSEFLATLKDPIVMLDPQNEVPEFYREAIVASGTRTVVVMPVTWQGELKALFYFASYRQNAFSQQDIALMHTIAAQLAPSIQVAYLHVQLERSYGHLKSAHLEALLRLAYAAEARDPYTECHLQRIRAIAQAIAARVGIQGDELEALGYGAIVHDLGKLRIPDSILINPGALSDEEWSLMKLHPQWGAEIIGDNDFYEVARQVALHHHERWDGSGYPFGLMGEDIPLAARIVSVADVYDALTTARPYKSAWSPERALVELLRMRGRTLCPNAVDVFMELWREGEISRIDAETVDESMEFRFRGLYAA